MGNHSKPSGPGKGKTGGGGGGAASAPSKHARRPPSGAKGKKGRGGKEGLGDDKRKGKGKRAGNMNKGPALVPAPVPAAGEASDDDVDPSEFDAQTLANAGFLLDIDEETLTSTLKPSRKNKRKLDAEERREMREESYEQQPRVLREPAEDKKVERLPIKMPDGTWQRVVEDEATAATAKPAPKKAKKSKEQQQQQKEEEEEKENEIEEENDDEEEEEEGDDDDDDAKPLTTLEAWHRKQSQIATARDTIAMICTQIIADPQAHGASRTPMATMVQ